MLSYPQHKLINKIISEDDKPLEESKAAQGMQRCLRLGGCFRLDRQDKPAWHAAKNSRAHLDNYIPALDTASSESRNKLSIFAK